MANNGTKPSMKEFAANDQANYYLGITSIKVNGKNAYELKRKFLDDLHNNAFSGTNREDTVEHIEYFLRIVAPIDLRNVNQDKLRVLVFPISLEECSSDVNETAEIFKIEDNLLDYETPLCKAFNEFNYLLKIDTDLFTFEIQEIKTYEEYELDNNMTGELEEPWSENRIPYQLCDHICEPYRFKNGMTKWPTCSSNIDGFFNGGDLLGMVLVGFMTYFLGSQMVNDHEKAPFVRWENYGQGPYANTKTKKDYDPYLDNNRDTQDTKKGRHDLSTFTIRRFEMVKYSFRDDEEYVAIKENEYDDLTNTSKEAIHAYQEIFRMMDEGWKVTRTE
ncbi:hypothetical protein Tco_0453431 [Tanacetum coccineum]